MFLAEIYRDPDHDFGLEACQIGKNLSQMCVIACFKLVLNKHFAVIDDVTSEDIGGVRPYSLFRSQLIQLQSNRLAKVVQIIGQPRCKMMRLVQPCFSDWHISQSGEAEVFLVHHTASSAVLALRFAASRPCLGARRKVARKIIVWSEMMMPPVAPSRK